MTKLSNILKVSTSHSYYVLNGGLCTDVEFIPTPQTQRLLNGYRLRIRYLPGGFEIHAPVKGTQALIPIVKDLNLRFELKPKSETFFQISSLPDKAVKGPFWISNRIESNISGFGSLNPFTSLIELKKNFKTQTIKLYPEIFGDVSPEDLVFDRVNDGFDPVDIDQGSWKLINSNTLKLSLSEGLENKELISVSYPWSESGVLKKAFAVLDIHLNKPTWNEQTEEFELQSYTLEFKARQEKWQYLFITPHDKALQVNETDSWELKVEERAYPAKFMELNSSHSPDSDNLMAKLVWDRLRPSLDLTKNKVYLLKSLNGIELQDKVLNDLELIRERSNGTRTVIFSELSNPAINNNGFSIVKKPVITS